jgi:hypothetical protein
MEFEAFFQKKKIDLQLLKQSDIILFNELEELYATMGAKSFDHSKKFLFNKWRRMFPLAIQEKPKDDAATSPKPYQPLFKRNA